MSAPHHPFVLTKSGPPAMETKRYQFHFEGPELQDLALAASLETRFREPYKHGEYTDEPAFWLVKEGRFYLINAHPNPEGRELPFVARPLEKQDAGWQRGDDYIEHLPITRTELDDLVSGKCGLFVSVGPTHCYAHRYRRPDPLVVD